MSKVDMAEEFKVRVKDAVEEKIKQAIEEAEEKKTDDTKEKSEEEEGDDDGDDEEEEEDDDSKKDEESGKPVEESLKVEAKIRRSEGGKSGDKPEQFEIKSLKELNKIAKTGKYDWMMVTKADGSEIEYTVSNNNKLIEM